MKTTPLQNFEEACERLKEAFLKELYPDKEDYEYILEDAYWVGGEIGGVLSFSDYFTDPLKMADYFRYSYTPDEFFKWYDQSYGDNEPQLNMKNFKLFNK